MRRGRRRRRQSEQSRKTIGLKDDIELTRKTSQNVYYGRRIEKTERGFFIEHFFSLRKLYLWIVNNPIFTHQKTSVYTTTNRVMPSYSTSPSVRVIVSSAFQIPRYAGVALPGPQISTPQSHLLRPLGASFHAHQMVVVTDSPVCPAPTKTLKVVASGSGSTRPCTRVGGESRRPSADNQTL